MGLISDLTPVNLTEEKKKFFSDRNYNPQFVYLKKELSKKKLQMWGLPDRGMQRLAERILKDCELRSKEEEVFVDFDEVCGEVGRVLKKFGSLCDLKVIEESGQTSRVLLKPKLGVLSIKKGALFSKTELTGLIRHEILTHWLRECNSRVTGLVSDEKSMRWVEEGLAILNSKLDIDDKWLGRYGAGYLAVGWAQVESFSQIFDKLIKYGFDESFCWRVCVRVKRGLMDTSQPGGMTKSIVYLGGAFQVWKWLVIEKNDPRKLYAGRVDLSEALRVGGNIVDSLSLPSFLLDLERYRCKIDEIAKVNFFEEIA